MIDKISAEHNSQRMYYRSTVGAAETSSKMQLGIRINSEEPIDKVVLRTLPEGGDEKLTELSTQDKASATEKFYSTVIQLPERGCLVWYYFIINIGERTYYYGNNAERLGGVGELGENEPPPFQITVFQKGAKTPDWFKHSVMYQVFPDRFYRDGNSLIEKRGAVFHASWEDDPCYYKDVDTKEVVAYDFFGGNARGLEQKLGYFKELGVNVLYLNPVFESESNHHYDTADYHKIDPIFGTNEEFKHFLDAAHEVGIKVILDGVFSHTGANSRYFNRAGMYDDLGAYQSKESPYYDWYMFKEWPDEYDCWWNFWVLPNIKEDTPSYMDFMIRNPDSVLHHWMGEGLSGWRLDVIDELEPEFSKAFYAEIKRIDPDAVVIGEIWEDASNKISYGVQRQYLSGYEIDSAMNYPFRAHVIDFLTGKTDGEVCMRRLESLRENYPKENFYAMMNLLGSHDVLRATTFFGEAPSIEGVPAIEQMKFRLDEEHEKLGKARLLMAALWQFTYPGVPCIYYGDEIAMQGFEDPTNRRPYDWKNGDDAIRAEYKKLIAMRNETVALRTGELLPLHAHGDIVSFARVIRNGRDVFGNEEQNAAYIAVFNRSKETRDVSLDVVDFANGVFVDVFDNSKKYPVSRGRVNVKLEALSGVLLRHIEPQQHYDHRAGILLHPTSLPSKYGVGDLGKEAFEFVDYLKSAGQSIWQILPLNPVGFGFSPYQSPSAFASNPMLISIDGLIELGLLEQSEVKPFESKNPAVAEFFKVKTFKEKYFKKAFDKFSTINDGDLRRQFDEFRAREAYWLDDYALFMALKVDNKDKDWTKWADEIKQREPEALQKASARLADIIEYEKFKQFIFDLQWSKLHAYAREKSIEILGDMPIFISADSADAWANQKFFKLNEDGTPKKVAGVPPDYFSATGQLWGNPQYDWDEMELDKYSWWKSRLKKLLEIVDIVRIDHFRGFEAYWEIDSTEKTAINGKWIKGPGMSLFTELGRDISDLSRRIVAEDLGVITDEVEQLRLDCGFPGMKILHFELHFNEDGRIGFMSPENSLVYTGTHDNNTTVGWYMEDIDNASKVTIAKLIGADARRPDDVCSKLIEFAYASNSRFAIIPMQDVLKLDSGSRMNTPGTVGTNWSWRLKPNYRLDSEAGKLKALCNKYKR